MHDIDDCLTSNLANLNQDVYLFENPWNLDTFWKETEDDTCVREEFMKKMTS